jgi:hypothetical protein
MKIVLPPGTEALCAASFIIAYATYGRKPGETLDEG